MEYQIEWNRGFRQSAMASKLLTDRSITICGESRAVLLWIVGTNPDERIPMRSAAGLLRFCRRMRRLRDSDEFGRLQKSHAERRRHRALADQGL